METLYQNSRLILTPALTLCLFRIIIAPKMIKIESEIYKEVAENKKLYQNRRGANKTKQYSDKKVIFPFI